MNKILLWLAFCALNSHGMHNPFLESLNPENILSAAMADLFDGFRTVHVNPDAESESLYLKRFGFTKPTPESIRRMISCGQAIISGTIVAIDDQATGSRIEFEAFDTTQKSAVPAQRYSMQLAQLNKHLYELRKNGITNESLIKEKKIETICALLHNPRTELSASQLFTLHAPRFLAFLNGTDLENARKKEIKKICTNDNLSKKEKKGRIAGIERDIHETQQNRLLYFAALATHDPVAINIERVKAFHSPFANPVSFLDEVNDMRRLTADGFNSLFDDPDQTLEFLTA